MKESKKTYEKHENFGKKSTKEGKEMKRSEMGSDKKMKKSAPMKKGGRGE